MLPGTHASTHVDTRMHDGTFLQEEWDRQNHNSLHRINFVSPPIHMGFYRVLGRTRDLEMV